MDAASALDIFLREENPAAAFTAYVQGYGGSDLPIGLWLSRQVALIDELINEQINVILHHPTLQALEARWRGLLALAEAAVPFDNVRIRLLDVSWRDVCRDIDRAAE